MTSNKILEVAEVIEKKDKKLDSMIERADRIIDLEKMLLKAKSEEKTEENDDEES